jgi:long-subunit fatty acid transport protein
MVGMGVNGGGGSLEFADGLASFERQFSVLPGAISQLGQMNPAMAVSANRYSMDMYLKGNSMTLAFNAGVAFRITDWLSVAAQLRYSTTSNGYEGYMKNIQINPTMAAMGLQGDMMSAAQFFTAAGAALGQLDPALAQQAAVYAAQTADHILDVKQKGTSISPVLALAFHKGKWDASVKYEFKMATELEIESEPISANDPVINGIFPNGAKVKSETPALLTAALSRHFGSVKVTAEWHNYFDKDAQNSFSPCITGNTNEYLLGAEWSISDKWLVSAGVQRTALNMDINKYSDMNFVTSSTSVAAGVKYNFSEKVGLNLGIMPTFYDKETAVGQASGINFTDVYHRTSIAWGIGLDLKFGRK